MPLERAELLRRDEQALLSRGGSNDRQSAQVLHAHFAELEGVQAKRPRGPHLGVIVDALQAPASELDKALGAKQLVNCSDTFPFVLR